MARTRISKTRKKRRRGYSPHDLTEVHPPLEPSGLTASELQQLRTLGMGFRVPMRDIHRDYPGKNTFGIPPEVLEEQKGTVLANDGTMVPLDVARHMARDNFTSPGGDASLEQAKAESEFTMLENARRRMEHYGKVKPESPDMVEALKYTLRRDPEGNIPSVPQYRPGLGDMEERKFIAGEGIQKGGRRPVTRGTYSRGYDTVGLDLELLKGTLGGMDEKAKIGELTPHGYTATVIPPHFLRKYGQLDPSVVPGNLSDVQLHELAGHRGTSYVFQSPNFRKHQGEFLGGKHRTRGGDDPDTPLGLQELFNKFTGRDKEYEGSPRDTREHSMVYQGTSLEPRGDRAKKDLKNYVKMIGSGYGEYDKETGKYTGGTGLAAEQLRAMRTYDQLKNLRELVGIDPEDIRSLSEKELQILLEILAAMGNPHRKEKLKQDEPWWKANK